MKAKDNKTKLFYIDNCIECKKDTRDIKIFPKGQEWIFICGDPACPFQRRTEYAVIDEYLKHDLETGVKL